MSDELRELVDAVAATLVTVHIENWYSDGHESERTIHLPAPTGDISGDLDEWFNEAVFPHTGDGHGTDSSLGSCYTASIVDAADKTLVGKSFEWTD